MICITNEMKVLFHNLKKSAPTCLGKVSKPHGPKFALAPQPVEFQEGAVLPRYHVPIASSHGGYKCSVVACPGWNAPVTWCRIPPWRQWEARRMAWGLEPVEALPCWKCHRSVWVTSDLGNPRILLGRGVRIGETEVYGLDLWEGCRPQRIGYALVWPMSCLRYGRNRHVRGSVSRRRSHAEYL